MRRLDAFLCGQKSSAVTYLLDLFQQRVMEHKLNCQNGPCFAVTSTDDKCINGIKPTADMPEKLKLL